MRFPFIPFFLVVLLNGCTAPGNMRPGLSEPDAIKSIGQPRAVYVLPDGTRRLEYSGSFTQETWMMDFQNGRLKRSEQVMTVEKFSQLKLGQDNKTSVQNLFGTPFEIVQLARLEREVWSYRLTGC
jgi:hypothetical protein